MKKPHEMTYEEGLEKDNALSENFKLAAIECWDELSRDDENYYKSEITLGLGRTRLTDGRIAEYQLTLQAKTEKFVEDEDRIDEYIND